MFPCHLGRKWDGTGGAAERVGPSWCLCMLACIQSADPSQLCSTHYRVGCAQHFPVMAAKVKLAGVVLGVSMASTKLMPVASEVVEGV